MENAPHSACLAVCGAFLFVLGLLPVEEVDGDRCGYGEVVSEAVVGFVDWCGFDSFDAVQQAVEAGEGVVVREADLSVVDFRVDSVFVEDGADFRLLHDEADDGGEVFGGFHLFAPFVLCQTFCLTCLIYHERRVMLVRHAVDGVSQGKYRS